MTTMARKIDTMDSIISDISAMVQGIAPRTFEGTIKDFTGIQHAIKLELALIKSDIVVTHLSGDCEAVLGYKSDEIIGKNILKILEIDPITISKAINILNQFGFVFKQNYFFDKNGKQHMTSSILMRRTETTFVEIVWDKEVQI